MARKKIEEVENTKKIDKVKNIKKVTTTKKEKTNKKIIKDNNLKQIETKNSFSTVEVIVLIIISVIVSLAIGSIVTSKLNKNKIVNNDKDLEKFADTYNDIIDNYYMDVDKEELLNSAVKGMLESLEDDYSYLIDEEESDTFDIQLDGEYEGIGIEIIGLTTGEVYINDVFEDSPADKGGLKVGDRIKKIDSMECTDKTVNDISEYIRKGNKSEFIIIVERDSKEKEIKIKREKVTIKAVTSKIFEKENKKVGYIYIEIFSNIAYKQFKEELKKLEKDKVDSLIIDVRDNTGGHLSTAVNIISLFLDSKHLIYQTDTKGKIEKFYSKGNETKKYPIVILQNSNSASASEMLSAALKEEYGATIIGEKSYGKGTVQELIDLSDDVEYKITTKKWLTPKGNWINKKGVSVDFEVSLNEEYYENPNDENDNQLQKALEEIIKK